MEYFLKRAEQELNVYFKKLSSSQITLSGSFKEIHTFRLKGTKLPTLSFYFGILCLKGKVYGDEFSILEETRKKFNELCVEKQALIKPSVKSNGDDTYTL